MARRLFKILLLLLFFIPGFALAQTKITPEIKIFDMRGQVKGNFFVLDKDYEGTTDLVTADLGGDGIQEIIVSAGGGHEPRVEVWRGNGTKIYDFLAYDKNFKGGVYLSAGNLDGDQQDEIVTGPGYSGGPHIRAFKGGADAILSFFVPGKHNGAKVLAIDLGGDGISEVITTSNFNEEPEINLFDNLGRFLSDKTFNLDNRGGINLAKIDLDGDKKEEIILAPGYGNRPEIMILNQKFDLVNKFSAYNENYIGGVNVASGDVNGDGQPEIITGASFAGGPHVKVFDPSGKLLAEFFAYDTGDRGGVKVAVGDIDGDRQDEIITLPERVFADLKPAWYKYISVDLSKQTLYFWQAGYQLGGFLISSGKRGTPTPKGEFTIFQKRPKVRMSWYYGPSSPMNYDLPNVPWVSSFKGPFTIHGTYWHHNFGHPMSHGCINMSTPDAKLIYDWVDIGTPVVIY